MYRIDHPANSPQQIRRSLQLAALDALLPDDEVEAICRDIGHSWRDRKLPPGVTLRSMVFRALHPDHSIAAVLADLGARMPESPAPSEAAWCQARHRLPEPVLIELISRRAQQCRRRFGRGCRWQGRWVFRIDGSTVSMPDEPALARKFGYADTRHGKSRFPVARVTFIELAGLNVIWDYRLDRYRRSEESQLYDMWHVLPEGCLCLMDRKFCSFYNLAKLRQRRVQVITPLHQRRDPHRLIAQGRKLGKNDWAVPLELDAASRREWNDPTLPPRLWVRLIRVCFRHGCQMKQLWLVTTMMDPATAPRHQIAELYRQRWDIEPRIGSLKTTLEMNVLRGKTPAAVRREVASIILGHNLVWMLMHEAAGAAKTPVADISFACAVKTVLAFSWALTGATASGFQAIYHRMLLHIARQQNHHPFGRVEPRLVKRDPVRYPYLREPRWKARLKCLS
jgi:hypothetical protein